MDFNANNKKRRTLSYYDYFDALPDDLVIDILSKFASSAESPSEFFNILICKRFKRLASHRLVLANVGPNVFYSFMARDYWSEDAHQFLNLSVRAGNLHACYAHGLIRKMLNLLLHAPQCRSHCQYPYCQKVKWLCRRHVLNCTTRVSGGCFLCNKMWDMLHLHAETCRWMMRHIGS